MSEHRPFYKLDFRHGTVEEIRPSVPETFREDWEAPGMDAYDLPIEEHPDYRQVQREALQWVSNVCLVMQLACALLAVGFAVGARHPTYPWMACTVAFGVFGVIRWWALREGAKGGAVGVWMERHPLAVLAIGAVLGWAFAEFVL